MRLWSELEPWEWRDELAKVHPELTEAFLVAAGRAVPELAPRINAQTTWEDKVRVALRYFGDQGQPQPAQGGGLAPAIFSLGDPNPIEVIPPPRWGTLPPLEPSPKGEASHEGGAPFKLWPRLALSEATRMWVQRAHNGSRREIARQVTMKVKSEIAAGELAEHRFETFTRTAVSLVVAAVEDGLLEWDAEKGLGVLGQFSATPEWLPIPRSQAVS